MAINKDLDNSNLSKEDWQKRRDEIYSQGGGYDQDRVLTRSLSNHIGGDPFAGRTDPGRVAALLNMIGDAEHSVSNAQSYNTACGNIKVNFTDMTINQVLKWQKENNPPGLMTSAAGKYQIIDKTLQGLVKQLGLTGEEKFDQAMQDKLAVVLLEGRGLRQFLDGKISPEKFMSNIAREWASLPVNHTGAGAYDGDGVNSAQVRPSVVASILNDIRNNRPGVGPVMVADAGPSAGGIMNDAGQQPLYPLQSAAPAAHRPPSPALVDPVRSASLEAISDLQILVGKSDFTYGHNLSTDEGRYASAMAMAQELKADLKANMNNGSLPVSAQGIQNILDMDDEKLAAVLLAAAKAKNGDNNLGQKFDLSGLTPEKLWAKAQGVGVRWELLGVASAPPAPVTQPEPVVAAAPPPKPSFSEIATTFPLAVEVPVETKPSYIEVTGNITLEQLQAAIAEQEVAAAAPETVVPDTKPNDTWVQPVSEVIAPAMPAAPVAPVVVSGADLPPPQVETKPGTINSEFITVGPDLAALLAGRLPAAPAEVLANDSLPMTKPGSIQVMPGITMGQLQAAIQTPQPGVIQHKPGGIPPTQVASAPVESTASYLRPAIIEVASDSKLGALTSETLENGGFKQEYLRAGPSVADAVYGNIDDNISAPPLKEEFTLAALDSSSIKHEPALEVGINRGVSFNNPMA